MPEIIIQKPITLMMDVLDIDDYTPSMKMLLSVEVNHPTGFFKYQADDIWFSCSEWDIFSNRLSDLGSEKDLLLKDLSEYFRIVIKQKSDNAYLFNLFCSEPEVGKGTTELNFSAIIDSDEIAQVINTFREFPKWW